MKTDTLIRTSVAAALLAAASLAVQARVTGAAAAPASTTLHVSSTLGHERPVPATYGWPVKPFERQHPVRGFLNDPRIGARSRAFHFGIDIAAPDGTAVYAVAGGTLYVGHGSVAVRTAPEHVFGYWHIRPVPSLKTYDVVRTHELLGYIAPGWGHVHFAERIGPTYVNPLRPGGLGPYTDPIAPSVTEISLVPQADGSTEILARASDTTWPPVPGPWTNEPVTPALLQWRVVAAGEPRGRWQTGVNFGSGMLPQSRFASVYAPQTRQNHEGKPGVFRFYVARGWKPADGSYRVEVAASDTRGNRTVAALDVTVGDGVLVR